MIEYNRAPSPKPSSILPQQTAKQFASTAYLPYDSQHSSEWSKEWDQRWRQTASVDLSSCQVSRLTVGTEVSSNIALAEVSP